VNYAQLMSLDGGKYANPDLAPVTDQGDSPLTGVHVEEGGTDFLASVIEQIEISARYSGYIDRQRDEVERASHYENLKLPADLDYLQVTALSYEVRHKLNKHRPETL